MEQRKQCFDVQGRVVNCVLTENWLNAAGVYIEQNDNGVAGAYVDLGSFGLTGFFGEPAPPPSPTDRTVFIDDPQWKHILKIALMILLAVVTILTAVKAVKVL